MQSSFYSWLSDAHGSAPGAQGEQGLHHRLFIQALRLYQQKPAEENLYTCIMKADEHPAMRSMA